MEQNENIEIEQHFLLNCFKNTSKVVFGLEVLIIKTFHLHLQKKLMKKSLLILY